VSEGSGEFRRENAGPGVPAASSEGRRELWGGLHQEALCRTVRNQRCRAGKGGAEIERDIRIPGNSSGLRWSTGRKKENTHEKRAIWRFGRGSKKEELQRETTRGVSLRNGLNARSSRIGQVVEKLSGKKGGRVKKKFA